jgi:hypothetical protein
MKQRILSCLIATVACSWAMSARADGPSSPTATAGPGPNDAPEAVVPSSDVRNEIPNLTYAYTAYGVSSGNVGVQASANSLVGLGQKASVGGGGTVWGSPFDRLTLIGDGQRDIFGNFAPSAAGVVRILGRPGDGFSLGVLGKFKVDGFSTGPNNEMESEIEGGLLASYAASHWHFDANAITGFGTGDDGEIDTEGRLRVGRDLGSMFRLGVDGQARFRVNGTRRLIGNRTWDFAGGPQLILGSSHFYGALTAGPATMGIVDNVGWTGVFSIGGTTL